MGAIRSLIRRFGFAAVILTICSLFSMWAAGSAQPTSIGESNRPSPGRGASSAFDFMSAEQIADVRSGAATMDVTSQLQSAIDHSLTLPNPVLYLPSGKYKVRKLVVPSKLLIVSDGATLLGSARGEFNAILDLTDCSNFNVDGKLYINGSYNPQYTYGVLVATSSPSRKAQYNNLQNVFVSSVMTAFGFGSELFPTAIVSENTLIATQTYDTPNVIKAYGVNTFVNVVGSVLDSTVSSSWGRAVVPTQYAVYAKGAKILIGGSEVLHTTHPLNGSAFCLDAISKDGGSSYFGEIYVSNSEIETAAPLLTTMNSSSSRAPIGGEMSFIGNTGWNGNNTFAFIQTGDEFAGRVYMRGNNFSAGAARTVPNISIGNIACVVDVDDGSFARNYKRGLSGIVGGTAKYIGKTLIDASQVDGQLLPASATSTLVYGSYVNEGGYSRFASDYYSQSTGVFTVPYGGLEDVVVTVMFGAEQPPPVGSELGVFVNGKAEYQMDFSGKVKLVTVSAAFGKLNGGDKVEVKFYNSGLSAISLMANSKHNRLVIVGSAR